jgi:hypothetical protein
MRARRDCTEIETSWSWTFVTIIKSLVTAVE